MNRTSKAGILVGGVLAALLGSSLLFAQLPSTFEVVHYFGATPEGAAPFARLLQTADGTIYGTTLAGGEYSRGTIFALKPNGMGSFDYSTIHSFTGPEGVGPYFGLVLGPDGYFYGSTNNGGLYGLGTAFRVDASGRVTVIHQFQDSSPWGELLVGSDGYLYGAASGGTAGLIYRMSLDGDLTSIHDFNAADGAAPNGALVESSDGYFYGTTFDGPGAGGASTIFRVNAAGDFSSLHVLTPDEGNWIRDGLVEVGGVFYGTASGGGAFSGGTLFKVDRQGALTKLHDFNSGGDDGVVPYPPPTLASDGNLYGTTYAGGANSEGALYRFDTTSGTTSTVDSFLFNTTGANPQGALIQGSDGLLYGTAADGFGLAGAVVRSGLGGNLEPVHAFHFTAGGNPIGGLVAASDGNLYGTTISGSTLFRLGTDGSFTTLASLGIHGSEPYAALAESPTGTLLGTARYGGDDSHGTAFSSDLEGNVTTLASCDVTNCAQPSGNVVRANGAVWATGSAGGSGFSYGTIFRVDAGNPVGVHLFNGADGSSPTNLSVGSDGALYGIATSGGPFTFDGTAFKIDPVTEEFTLLHSFGTDPGDPVAPTYLTAVAGGAVLGTSSNGGAHGDGALFELGTDGTVTVLHSFDSDTEASAPNSIMKTSDGHFVGTTNPGDKGTVFELGPGDEVAVILHYFSDGTDGGEPTSPLVEAPDGSLYGTTYQGGQSNLGVVYRFVLPIDPTIVAIAPTSGPAAGGTSVVAMGTHFRIEPFLYFGGVIAPLSYDFDAATAATISPPLAPGALYDVRLDNPDGSTATLPHAWFADFLDVSSANIFHDSIETIFRSGITVGCGIGSYCPANDVSRAEMAVFLLKAKYGADHVPPPPVQVFPDVPDDAFAAAWIDELASLGITGGCGGGLYCPDRPVSRAEMAVFLLKTLVGSGYVPPMPVGIFADVPLGSFAVDFIEDLYNRGITAGCATSPLRYCPDADVPREQMATFLVRTFGL